MTDETVQPNAEPPDATDTGFGWGKLSDSIRDPANSKATSLSSTTAKAPTAGSRRSFLVRFAAAAIGTVLSLAPLLTGLLFFFDPLIRKRSASSTLDNNVTGVTKDDDDFILLTITVDALPIDAPLAFTVHDNKVDAWNKFLNVPIGTIWLRKNTSGEIIAFSTICPHLGCSVEFQQGRNEFYCPCHLSAFNLDGDRKNSIPPRNMDRLEIKSKTGNDLWVKYQDFRGGTKDKTPV